MTVIPSMTLAGVVVYALSGYIGRFFSQNVASVVDLILFVTFFIATNSLLKNLRDG
jgi:hypothetical protein